MIPFGLPTTTQLLTALLIFLSVIPATVLLLGLMWLIDRQLKRVYAVPNAPTSKRALEVVDEVASENVTSNLDRIRNMCRRKPFVPFVIVATSGDRLVIENGDALAMSSSQLHYFPPPTDRGVHMRVSEIASLESPAASMKRDS